MTFVAMHTQTMQAHPKTGHVQQGRGNSQPTEAWQIGKRARLDDGDVVVVHLPAERQGVSVERAENKVCSGFAAVMPPKSYSPRPYIALTDSPARSCWRRSR